MITGVMRRIVVTLSRTAEMAAVRKQSRVNKGQTLPLVTLKDQKPR